jgi:hypothetical protein
MIRFGFVSPRRVRVTVVLARESDHLRSPTFGPQSLHLLADATHQIVKVALGHALVQHHVLAALHADTGEAVRAIDALHAQHQIARALART